MAEIIRIDRQTWRIEDGMVRFFVLEGDEKALMIDSGMNTPDAVKYAKELSDKPLEMLNTHADRDHISGNGAFEKIYMSSNEEANYRAAGGAEEIAAGRVKGEERDMFGNKVMCYQFPYASFLGT